MSIIVPMVLSFGALRVMNRFLANGQRQIGTVGQVGIVFLFCVSLQLLQFGFSVLRETAVYIPRTFAVALALLAPPAFVFVALWFGLHQPVRQSLIYALGVFASFWFCYFVVRSFIATIVQL